MAAWGRMPPGDAAQTPSPDAVQAVGPGVEKECSASSARPSAILISCASLGRANGERATSSPEKVMKLYKELGITSLAALEEASRADRLKGVKGLGPALQAKNNPHPHLSPWWRGPFAHGL